VAPAAGSALLPLAPPALEPAVPALASAAIGSVVPPQPTTVIEYALSSSAGSASNLCIAWSFRSNRRVIIRTVPALRLIHHENVSAGFRRAAPRRTL